MGDMCSGDAEEEVIETEIEVDAQWAKAIAQENMTAIQVLHYDDASLINAYVSNDRLTALHRSVEKKNGEMLAYFLNAKANPNVRGGAGMKTPLHLAVANEDWFSVRELLSFGAKDDILDDLNKMAIDYCPKKMRREYMKSKQFKRAHLLGYQEEEQKRHEKRESVLMVAGMDLKTVKDERIQKYIDKNDDNSNWEKRKEKEIRDRDLPISEIGIELGIELDEVAFTLSKHPDLGVWWTKITKKDPPFVSKQQDLYKILMQTIMLALRKKDPKAKKPQVLVIKKLTTRLTDRLPKKGGRKVLEKEHFCKQFVAYLYDMHEQIIDDEEALADREEQNDKNGDMLHDFDM